MFDKIQDYEELEQYFNEIPKFTVKHSLEETRRALAVLESAGECTKETFSGTKVQRELSLTRK